MPALPGSSLPAKDDIVAIKGNRSRIKSNSGCVVLKARKSYSNGEFAIVYQSCLFLSSAIPGEISVLKEAGVIKTETRGTEVRN